jgi:hypothetical protein
MNKFWRKIVWAKVWSIFSQAHLVTLVSTSNIFCEFVALKWVEQPWVSFYVPSSHVSLWNRHNYVQVYMDIYPSARIKAVASFVHKFVPRRIHKFQTKTFFYQWPPFVDKIAEDEIQGMETFIVQPKHRFVHICMHGLAWHVFGMTSIFLEGQDFLQLRTRPVTTSYSLSQTSSVSPEVSFSGTFLGMKFCTWACSCILGFWSFFVQILRAGNEISYMVVKCHTWLWNSIPRYKILPLDMKCRTWIWNLPPGYKHVVRNDHFLLSHSNECFIYLPLIFSQVLD